ncbi:MAG TPA: ankyrin repeat domain-containing protein, partial [Nitrospirales bacterium]|nr:ankyrin repeat domain-containing protein [Nitrospirales bacterium]
MLRKPSDNWPYLRTTNPIESTFATVRLRTARTKDANVNAKDEVGWTLLHTAAFYGHKEIAELLITKGADVNAKDEDSWTPLHWAVAVGHKELVALLIAG